VLLSTGARVLVRSVSGPPARARASVGARRRRRRGSGPPARAPSPPAAAVWSALYSLKYW